MRFPFHVVFRQLLAHPIRTLLTAGSLTLALFMLCLLRSLVVTLESGVRDARSDRFIVQSSVSLFVYLPESYGGKIRAVDGVEDVLRFTWFGGYYQDPANQFPQFAIDPDVLFRAYPEIEIVDGTREAFLADRRGCIVGDGLTRRFGFSAGDPLPLIGALYARPDETPWQFQVAAVYHSNSANVDNNTLFFHHEYLDESVEQGTARGPNGVGVFVVRMGADADPIAVMSAVDALFENGPQRVQSTPESEFQAQFVSMIGNVPFFVGAIGGGVLLAILLAVVNTMIMAGRQQTRDSGILKALGFGNRSILFVLLLQGLVVCGFGGGLGILLARASSEAVAGALGSFFPGFAVTNETVLLGAGVTLAIGVIASAPPAWRLARQRVVQALAAEV